jgi:hypothetical protein
VSAAVGAEVPVGVGAVDLVAAGVGVAVAHWVTTV